MTDEEVDRARDEEFAETLDGVLGSTFVAGGPGNRAGVAHEDELPALDWAMWSGSGHEPQDTADEMVEALSDAGLDCAAQVPHHRQAPPEGRLTANPRRRRGAPSRPDAGMQALKRKLMR